MLTARLQTIVDRISSESWLSRFPLDNLPPVANARKKPDGKTASRFTPYTRH